MSAALTPTQMYLLDRIGMIRTTDGRPHWADKKTGVHAESFDGLVAAGLVEPDTTFVHEFPAVVWRLTESGRTFLG